MKFQNQFGEEKQLKEIDGNDIELFALYGGIQEIGDVLNIKGKFRVNYGFDHILNAIISSPKP